MARSPSGARKTCSVRAAASLLSVAYRAARFQSPARHSRSLIEKKRMGSEISSPLSWTCWRSSVNSRRAASGASPTRASTMAQTKCGEFSIGRWRVAQSNAMVRSTNSAEKPLPLKYLTDKSAPRASARTV